MTDHNVVYRQWSVVQRKEYAPVLLQDEGASRGATCFHYYPLSFQERAGVMSLTAIILACTVTGATRFSYDTGVQCL